MPGEEVCNFGYAVFLALLTYHMACFFVSYMGPVWRWLWDSLVRSQTLGVTVGVRGQGQALDEGVQQYAHTHPVVIALVAWPLVFRGPQISGHKPDQNNCLPPSALLFVAHKNT